MSVYFMKRPDGAVKIGTTGDLNMRFSALQAATPGLTLLATCEGGHDVETYLHRVLSKHRLDGEFFHPAEEVQSAVEAAIDDASFHRTNFLRVEANGSQEILAGDREGVNGAMRQARFYLNWLVQKEWQGLVERPGEARNRVADKIGVPATYLRRLWNRPGDMPDVSGEAWMRLRRTFFATADRSGLLTDYESYSYFIERMNGSTMEEKTAVTLKMRTWSARTGVTVQWAKARRTN